MIVQWQYYVTKDKIFASILQHTCLKWESFERTLRVDLPTHSSSRPPGESGERIVAAERMHRKLVKVNTPQNIAPSSRFDMFYLTVSHSSALHIHH